MNVLSSLISLGKTGMGRRDMRPLYTYAYTEHPTNLTPGHGEIRAHSGKASPPRLPTSYQRWNGSHEPSHVLSDTEQVVGASEKCFLLSKVCVICKVCVTVGVL